MEWVRAAAASRQVASCRAAQTVIFAQRRHKRLFFRFSTGGVAGKQIRSATMSAFETHSSSCTLRAMEAWRTGAFGTATNWTNALAWRRIRSDAKLSVVYNTPPAVPSLLGTTSPTTCVRGASRPVINDSTQY